jgi:ketosteroid isomerase-like protein
MGDVKKYDILSIEPTDLVNHWVITYRTACGSTDKQSVMAMDTNDAFIVFRNQMINEGKAKFKLTKP